MNAALYLLGYILFINLLGFVIMASDKHKAKIHAFRIPEATLFAVALLGGSAGSIAGMYTFHHKTKHLKFVIGMPVILILQVILFVCIMNSGIEFKFV